MEIPVADKNVILGTSISIHDLHTASQTANHILSLGPSAATITKLSITTELPESYRDLVKDEVSQLTSPITQILSTIASTGGSLVHFAWLAPQSTNIPLTRPPTFWTALYAHAPTLESLQLEFFEHEVHTVPNPPSTFPSLTSLALDTSSAHGDDGSSIHALLRSCPTLSKLSFVWPICDLSTCQITNIDWDAYTFPHLTHLSLNGWDFAPVQLAAFLARHPSIQVLRDGVDGPYLDDDDDEEAKPLEKDTLPNLCTLWKSHAFSESRSLVKYFDVRAKRAIKHLTLDIGFGGYVYLEELVGCEKAREGLEVVELEGGVERWRVEEEEDEENVEKEEDKIKKDEDKIEKDEHRIKDEEENITKEDPEIEKEDEITPKQNDETPKENPKSNIPPILPAMHTFLSHLHALRDLTIQLASGTISSRNPATGEWESGEPANQKDLVSSPISSSPFRIDESLLLRLPPLNSH
jgi:hypothetical protein